MAELTEQQRAMLAFERQWWRRPGAKEAAILATFGCSATRYYQELNRVLEGPAAVAIDPVTVRRLQRIRARKVR